MSDSIPHRHQAVPLALTALGVVYGDIGTSPLYALRECFHGEHLLRATPANVLGVLSLIFWALIVIISLKYLLLVMRADNRGEGGILALLALLNPWRARHGWGRMMTISLGLFGAALLYGDGAITPAISVLSAIEGLKVATPLLTPVVVPTTIAILIALFLLQKRGTAGIGALFGPVMIVWFATIALLGIRGITMAPEVLAAVNPLHAIRLFARDGMEGFLILGSVFLVVTGGEALYADMGHFGRPPIRLAWFACVLPALLLNYFGQGALLLRRPFEATEPFYHLAPSWALYPLVLLATAATIIASQAVISGAFSLTRQAVQLGMSPRMRIIQTSSEEIGQIYIPAVNWALMGATVALVTGFHTSSNLAAAYGVAVTTTMVITTVLIFAVMRKRWRWGLLSASSLTAVLLTVDLAFFAANMFKVEAGGWLPLAAGLALFVLMKTWYQGRELLSARLQENVIDLRTLMEKISFAPPIRVPGVAVFMSGRLNHAPPMLLHHLQHNQVLHETVVLLTVVTEDSPRVAAADRLELEDLSHGFYRLIARYGFMQSPNVPVLLRACEPLGLTIDPDEASYYLARETLIPTERVRGMPIWREKLFAFMVRNALQATAFYNLPPDRVVELGQQVEI
ncbi:putative potassium transport system protein kup 1 [Geotalea uraniireducens]|uniref:Probable potassium transport system protein Kup n=1 Tax=Geotalea uraniireducens TaxID=351604 RepID=A0ABN6VXD5_9BACT|nr:potassium transporter Kup [Geotalea uraniireducens]BDV43781.1 putative potassium transport system protein kup 1 [Geotalea uraniireducens]